jgi:Na+/H+-dicarboxylate symporter
MRVSPVAVFAAMTKAIATNGLEVLLTFGKFIGSFYLGLAILWIVLIFAGFLVIGPRIGTLIKYIRDPILLAFSTASSEAAYPRTLEALDKFGVPNRISSFVLPLGYSFNLDGSMMYMTFASIFIAQLAGINLTIEQEITMLLTLMLTSKGMAAVPRASLVVIAGTMAQFGLPEAGLILILAVDQFLDMGRTGTNVVGNAVATAVVAKWEGALDKPQPLESIDTARAPSSTLGTARPAPREGEPGGVS